MIKTRALFVALLFAPLAAAADTPAECVLDGAPIVACIEAMREADEHTDSYMKERAKQRALQAIVEAKAEQERKQRVGPDGGRKLTLEFKGVPFGSSPNELRNGMGKWFSFDCGTVTQGSFDQYCHIEGATYANEPTSMIFVNFEAERLAVVTIRLKPESFDAAIGALQEKHGKPQSDAKSTVKNALGATFPQRRVEWVLKDGTIAGRRYAGTVTTAEIIIASNEALALIARKLNAKPPAKKDI